VFRESVRPVLAGLALGIGAALGMGRLVASLLYEVGPSDPIVLASVATAVMAAALFACLAPLGRALRIDPASALRAE
jgi:putative ABC transport system permease protein